jgi:hypothetical protein
MNVWRILGGAAIGVGAVAAAPFTGGGSILGAATLLGSLAGAGTIAAAVGVGAAGALVGASIGDGESDEDAYMRGLMDGKADIYIKLQALKAKINSKLEELDDIYEGYDAILAMEAVAIACANCDGEICAAEQEHIEMFIHGVSKSAIPDSIKERINDIHERPLSLRQAFHMAKNTGIEFDVFDQIVDVVIHADDIVHEKETAFLESWNALKAAELGSGQWIG